MSMETLKRLIGYYHFNLDRNIEDLEKAKKECQHRINIVCNQQGGWGNAKKVAMDIADDIDYYKFGETMARTQINTAKELLKCMGMEYTIDENGEVEIRNIPAKE